MTNPTDTNQASELYELCKEVYERTRWEDDEIRAASWAAIHYEQYKSENLVDPMTPLYTSDYLLEKLPEWIGKYGDMQMSRGYMKGSTGAFRFFYGRDGQEASIEGTGTTAVSALLKLTIALSEAGELNKMETEL